MTKPEAWLVISSLGSALDRGGNTLEHVPGLLKRLLVEELWREFVTPRGELVHHDRFDEFLTTPPTHGLGTSYELVRRMVSDDDNAVTALDEAVQRPPGRPKTHNNVMSLPQPEGNSHDQALRRLRKDRPDLHAEVLAKRLSAHAAMVQAGFRPKTATIRISDAESAARTLRRAMPSDVVTELAYLLLTPSEPDPDRTPNRTPTSGPTYERTDGRRSEYFP
jgi:hypothetical protein